MMSPQEKSQPSESYLKEVLDKKILTPQTSTPHQSTVDTDYITNTARKTIFSFFKCSEKMVFPRKLHWNMIFLVVSEKMIFLFFKNLILFLRQKVKDDLSQKNTWKYDIFYKYSEKMAFPKKLH